MLDANALLKEVDVLTRLLLERDAALASRDLTIREKDRHIEHLKFQLAKLRRWKSGQASEALESAGQIALSLEEIASALADTLPASTNSEAKAAATDEDRIHRGL